MAEARAATGSREEPPRSWLHLTWSTFPGCWTMPSASRLCVSIAGQRACAVPPAIVPQSSATGATTRKPCRQRYRCRACASRFDDLTGTVLAGHHQPLRVWVAVVAVACSPDHRCPSCSHATSVDTDAVRVWSGRGRHRHPAWTWQACSAGRQGTGRHRRAACLGCPSTPRRSCRPARRPSLQSRVGN